MSSGFNSAIAGIGLIGQFISCYCRNFDDIKIKFASFIENLSMNAKR